MGIPLLIAIFPIFSGVIPKTRWLFLKLLNKFPSLEPISITKSLDEIFIIFLHSKNKCISERRTLMIEFQPKNLNAPRSSIDLNNLNISKKVLDNIDLFLPNDKNSKDCYASNHGQDLDRNNYPTFFISKSIILVFQKLTKNFLIKPAQAILKKIKIKLAKL